MTLELEGENTLSGKNKQSSIPVTLDSGGHLEEAGISRSRTLTLTPACRGGQSSGGVKRADGQSS